MLRVCKGPGCAKEGRLSCVECGVARYCSKECQKKDWKERHREYCKDTKETRRRTKDFASRFLASTKETATKDKKSSVDDVMHRDPLFVEGKRLSMALYNRAQTEHQKKEFNQALDMYEQCLATFKLVFGEISREVGDVHYRIGLILKDCEELDRALLSFHSSASVFLELPPSLDFHDNLIDLFFTIGLIHDSRFEFEESLVMLHRALDLTLDREEGKGSKDIADLYTNIAAVHKEKGDYDSSILFFQKALDVLCSIDCQRERVAALVFSGMAEAHKEKGELSTALTFHQQAFELNAVLFSLDSQEIAESHDDLGMIYLLLGNTEKALDHHLVSFNIKKKIYGESHDQVARAIGKLGVVHRSRKDFDLALLLFQKSLAVSQRLHGNVSKEVASVLAEIANVFVDREELDKSLEYYQQALDIFKILASEDGSHTKESTEGLQYFRDVAHIISNIGFVFEQKNEIDRAIEHFQHSSDIYKRIFGMRRREVAESLHKLAVLHKRKGDNKEALDLFLQTLSVYEKTGGFLQEISRVLHSIGSLYNRNGELDQAQIYMTKSLEIKEMVHGKNSAEVADALCRISLVCDSRFDFFQGAQYLERAISIKESLLGPESHEMASVFQSLAIMQKNKNNLSASFDLFSKAESIYRSLGPNGKLDLSNVLFSKASIHYDRSECDQALGLFREAIKLFESIEGKISENISRTLSSIGLVHKRQNNFALAIDCFRSALVMSFLVAPNNPDLDPSLEPEITLPFDISEETGDENVLKQISQLKQYYGVICKLFGHNSRETAELLFEAAEFCEKRKRHDQSRLLFQHTVDMLRLIHHLHFNPIAASALYNLSLLAERRRDFEEAKKFFFESQAILNRIHGSRCKESLKVVVHMGFIAKELDNYVDLINYYYQFLDHHFAIFNTTDEDVDLLFIFLDLTFKEHDDREEALAAFEETLKFPSSDTPQDRNRLASILMNIAGLFIESEQFETATDCYELCLRLKRHLQNPDQPDRDLGEILFCLGQIHCFQQQYEEALEHMERALSIFQLIQKNYPPHPPSSSSSSSSPSSSSSSSSSNSQAPNPYSTSKSPFCSSGDVREAIVDVYVAFSAVQRFLENNEESMNYLERALALKMEISSEEGQSNAIILFRMGDLLREQKMSSEAIEKYNEALRIKRALGEVSDDREMAYGLYSAGQAYLDLREIDQSLYHLQLSLDIFTRVFGETHREVGELYGNLGMLYMEKHEKDKAIEYFQRSLEVYCRICPDDSEEVAEITYRLADLLKQNGDFAQSLELFQSSLSMLSRIHSSPSPPSSSPSSSFSFSP